MAQKGQRPLQHSTLSLVRFEPKLVVSRPLTTFLCFMFLFIYQHVFFCRSSLQFSCVASSSDRFVRIFLPCHRLCVFRYLTSHFDRDFCCRQPHDCVSHRPGTSRLSFRKKNNKFYMNKEFLVLFKIELTILCFKISLLTYFYRHRSI